MSRASQAAGVSLMASCPDPGLPTEHAGTRASAQPRRHMEARRRPGGESRCCENAGNAQAGGGEPSACLGNRRPTSSRYMAACGPGRRSSLPSEGKALRAPCHIMELFIIHFAILAATAGPDPWPSAAALRHEPPQGTGRPARTCLSGRPRRSRSGRVPRISRQISAQSTQRSVSPLPRRSAKDISAVRARRYVILARTRCRAGRQRLGASRIR